MSKLGDNIHATEGGHRIFVGPDVSRYDTEEGGEVIVVNNPVEFDDTDTDGDTED